MNFTLFRPMCIQCSISQRRSTAHVQCAGRTEVCRVVRDEATRSTWHDTSHHRVGVFERVQSSTVLYAICRPSYGTCIRLCMYVVNSPRGNSKQRSAIPCTPHRRAGNATKNQHHENYNRCRMGAWLLYRSMLNYILDLVSRGQCPESDHSHCDH